LKQNSLKKLKFVPRVLEQSHN